jgi:hypothetical protein
MTALLHRLDQDYPACAVLFALLARQADLSFVKASQRDLSESMAGCVSPRHVNRALSSLESIGLVERVAHPNTTTRYRVAVPMLRALLATPLFQAEVIPGLTPLPALDRIFVADPEDGRLENHSEGLINA